MIKIALTKFRKHNEGNLVYTWLELPATNDEIRAALEKIGAVDGDYFISDYEAPFEINECGSLEVLNEIAKKINTDSDIQYLLNLWNKWEENKNYIRYNRNFQNEILSTIIYINDKYDLNVADDIIHFDRLQEMVEECVNEYNFIKLKYLLSGLDDTDDKDYFYLDRYGNANSLHINDIHELLKETLNKLKEALARG